MADSSSAELPKPPPPDQSKPGKIVKSPEDPTLSRKDLLKTGLVILGGVALASVLPKGVVAEEVSDKSRPADPLKNKQDAAAAAAAEEAELQRRAAAGVGLPVQVRSGDVKGSEAAKSLDEAAEYQAKLLKLGPSVRTVFPANYLSPRVKHSWGNKDYYVYATLGPLGDGRFLPTIKTSSPDSGGNSLAFIAQRATEKIAGLINIANSSYPAKNLATFYGAQTGRKFDEDYRKVTGIFNINNYADVSNIKEVDPEKPEDLAAQAYEEVFARVWMTPEKLINQIKKEPSEELRQSAANLALTVIRLTLGCASSPTTTESIGLQDKYFGQLVDISGNQDYWKQALKVST